MTTTTTTMTVTTTTMLMKNFQVRDTLRLRISPGRESLLYQEIIEVIMMLNLMMVVLMVLVVLVVSVLIVVAVVVELVVVLVVVVVDASDCRRILSGSAFINSSLLHYTAKGRLLHEDNIEH